MTDNRVSYIFNEMEEYYDDIVDLWYSWIFSRLHFFIAKEIISQLQSDHKTHVLDIGCGTGFQSILFAKAGCLTSGVDISEKLVSVASRKSINANEKFELFEPQFSFVERYNQKVSSILSRFSEAPIYNSKYSVGDATLLEFEAESFEIINCCGSTLSFIQDHTLAIKEISRCLKPHGKFVIEVEAKTSFDLFWTLLDSTMFFGLLGFETSFKEAKNLIFRNRGHHVSVEYPFGDTKNPVYMNLKLFNKKLLIKELKDEGLIVNKCYNIHSITNLIPSTILDTENPSRLLRVVFNFLSKIEEAIGSALPGCSMVLTGYKN